MGADNMTDREPTYTELQPGAVGEEAAEVFAGNFGRVTASDTSEGDSSDDLLEEVDDPEPVRVPTSAHGREPWDEPPDEDVALAGRPEELPHPPEGDSEALKVPEISHVVLGPAAGSVATFTVVDTALPSETSSQYPARPTEVAAEVANAAGVGVMSESRDAVGKTHDHSLEGRAEPEPEAPRAVDHNELDDFTVEVIQNGGKIPEGLRIDPDDLAVVRTVVALVEDNLARLTPGARQTRTVVVRAMASDQQIVRSATNGVGWATAIAMQRSLELNAENPRAKLARQVAYSVAGEGDATDPFESGGLEDIALKVVTHWFGDKYMGNTGPQLAPYLAAYAVEQAGGYYQSNPEVVAATVLGFEHSCEVTGFRLKDYPPSFQALRLAIRDTLEGATNTVREELAAARRLLYVPAERARALVTIGCAEVAAGHSTREGAARRMVAEAARRAEAAERAKQEAARAAEAAKARALQEANVRSSLNYNYRAALPPRAIGERAITMLDKGDIGQHIMYIAALFDHLAGGSPDAEAVFSQVRPRLNQESMTAVVDYVQSLRPSLLEGNIPPEVPVVMETMRPSNVDDAAVRARLQDLRQVVNYAATRYFTSERVEWSPPAIRLARAGFIVERRNAGIVTAIERLREARRDSDAETLQRLRDERVLGFVGISEEVGSDQLQIPEKLQALVNVAREHRQKLEAAQEAAREEAAMRASPLRRIMAAVRTRTRQG